MTVIPPIPTNPTHGFAVEGPGDFVLVNESVRVDCDNNSVHPACAGERTAAPVRIDFIIYLEAVIAVAFRMRYLVVIVAAIVIVVVAAVAVSLVVVFFVLIVGSTGLMTAIVALVIINVGLLMLQCECTQGTHTHVTH